MRQLPMATSLAGVSVFAHRICHWQCHGLSWSARRGGMGIALGFAALQGKELKGLVNLVDDAVAKLLPLFKLLLDS
ncbi:MAG: hypothetical protein IJ762_11070 [Bacteroidaceae bacterium]|nr:hypothetical protein [Bacteroidaceae bacterium]